MLSKLKKNPAGKRTTNLPGDNTLTTHKQIERRTKF